LSLVSSLTYGKAHIDQNCFPLLMKTWGLLRVTLGKDHQYFSRLGVTQSHFCPSLDFYKMLLARK
jgi:hypothetical protein